MSFEKGPINVTMFKLRSKLPEDYLERFAAYAAKPLEEVKDEPQLGWTTGRHLLETKIDEQTAICGGHLYLNLRKAERKIPALTLKTICQREELIYMQANKVEFVPSKVKREIKENAIESTLMKMPVSLSGIPFVIDLSTEIIYAGSTSPGQLDGFICFFFKTTGLEPIHINIGTMCEDLGIQEADLPSVNFSPESKAGDLTPGRDFLTWLWYCMEKLNERAGFEMMVEGPLTFAAADEARGAHDIAIKNGSCPLRSSEAKSALLAGKKLKKAKIAMACEGNVWSFTFDADKFVFSSLTLPEGEEMEHHSGFQERIMNLDRFRQAIELYFKTFAHTVRAIKWPETEKKIQDWVLNRDSY
ncbi:MAG: hypothetical protein ACYC4Q_10600 [Victivallaceae bacterium]